MAGAVPVSQEGNPLYIPADDGGMWNLVYDPGYSCPLPAVSPPAQPAVSIPQIVTPIPGGETLIV